MALFAELDDDNVVLRVIVVSNADLIGESGDEEEAVGQQYLIDLFGGTWVQTSYHGKARGRFARRGYTDDSGLDEFIPPQPFPSWTWQFGLSPDVVAQWVPPVAAPADGEDHDWDEENQTWNPA